MKNILVIGSGGREHSLCLAIQQSPQCGKLFCLPGNAGIADVATCLPIKMDDEAAILATCREHAINFVVVGPEAPLVAGLADAIRAAGIPCFGPSKLAAELEGSKGFMKDLCARAGVPTAAYQRFKDPVRAKQYIERHKLPIVIKADGLAAGKGVIIAQTHDEAMVAVDLAMEQRAFGDAGNEIVIEEFLQGEEVSFFALCDGKTAVAFGSAQDHKAVFDGDKGPNTGGMGAYSPAPIVTQALHDRIMKQIILPVVDGMNAAGRPFVGVLFAGIMVDDNGPKVLEFNARFGDPETQVLFARLKSDALEALLATAEGRLSTLKLEWRNDAAL